MPNEILFIDIRRWTLYEGAELEEQVLSSDELQRVDECANKPHISYTSVCIDGSRPIAATVLSMRITCWR